MCEHDDTHVCTRPHAFMHVCTDAYTQRQTHGVSVHKLVLSLTHTLKTRGCRIISSPSRSYNQRPEGVPALQRGVFIPQTSVAAAVRLLWFIPSQSNTCTSSQHFTFCSYTQRLNNAQLCFRSAASYSRSCQLWFSVTQLLEQVNLNTPVCYSVQTPSFTQVVTHAGRCFIGAGMEECYGETLEGRNPRVEKTSMCQTTLKELLLQCMALVYNYILFI